MQYEEYVSEGRRALAEERNAGQRLSELAAGVELEYGRLGEWAEAIDIDYWRAVKLRNGGKVNNEIGVDSKLPWSVAAEAVRVPADKLPSVIEKAIEITRQLGVDREATSPSLRGVREAAKAFSKKPTKSRREAREAELRSRITAEAITAKQSLSYIAVELRDGGLPHDEIVRVVLKMYDECEALIAEGRELLPHVTDEALQELIGRG